jgi:hypothetical protein
VLTDRKGLPSLKFGFIVARRHHLTGSVTCLSCPSVTASFAPNGGRLLYPIDSESCLSVVGFAVVSTVIHAFGPPETINVGCAATLSGGR